MIRLTAFSILLSGALSARQFVSTSELERGKNIATDQNCDKATELNVSWHLTLIDKGQGALQAMAKSLSRNRIMAHYNRYVLAGYLYCHCTGHVHLYG
jgi:hypothetical protein